ncbi:MAG TPA: hypothetical protein VJM09_06115 [Sphingobium sp.]|nr:hypothetical protein [Sphingobium sp.]
MPVEKRLEPKRYSASLLSAMEAVSGGRLSGSGERMRVPREAQADGREQRGFPQ